MSFEDITGEGKIFADPTEVVAVVARGHDENGKCRVFIGMQNPREFLSDAYAGEVADRLNDLLKDSDWGDMAREEGVDISDFTEGS